MLRIPRAYRRRLLLRGLMLSALIHVALTMVSGGDVIVPNATSALIIAAAVAVLTYIEIVFRREAVFLRNLGAGTADMLILPVAVSLLLDALLLSGKHLA